LVYPVAEIIQYEYDSNPHNNRMTGNSVKLKPYSERECLIEKGIITPYIPETRPDIQIQKITALTNTIESGAILPLEVKVRCVSGNCTSKDFKILVDEMIDINAFRRLTKVDFTMSGFEDSVTVFVKIPKVDHERTMTLIITLSGDYNWDNNRGTLVINVKPSQKKSVNGFEIVEAMIGILISELIILMKIKK